MAERGAVESPAGFTGSVDATPNTLDRQFLSVYAQLRRLARRQLALEQPGHTLDSAALLHEAYLKLADHGAIRWESEAHFFAIASRAMRSLLVDHARARLTDKRGAGAVAVTLEQVAGLSAISRDEDVLALDEALLRLAEINEEASRLVECRFFAGLTLEESAAALGLSVATARRRWSFAKAWLHRALTDE